MQKESLKFLLASQLRDIRSSRGLALKELAKRSKLSTSYLNEIEKGKKYPSMEKLVQISQALGTDIENLSGLSMDPQQVNRHYSSLIDFIESEAPKQLVADLLNFDIDQLIGLLSQSPKSMSQLMSTVLQLVRKFDIGMEDVYDGALRAYIQANHNFFPELEDIAKSSDLLFLKKFDLSILGQHVFRDTGLKVSDLDLSEFHGFEQESVLVHHKSKRVFLNQKLTDAQKFYYLTRVYCEEYLKIQFKPNIKKISSETRMSEYKTQELKYSASYLACASIIPEAVISKKCREFFRKDHFDSRPLIDLFNDAMIAPELLLNRVSQILTKCFGIYDFFYLRCNRDLDRPNSFRIAREFHVGDLHFPHGTVQNEHYCRRWISVDILNKLDRKIKSSQNYKSHLDRNLEEKLDSKSNSTQEFLDVSAQISELNGKKYLCISLAQRSSTRPKTLTSLTLGILLTDETKKQIHFLSDPQIQTRSVGQTCERCPIENCQERISDPVLGHKIKVKEAQKQFLSKLETDPSFLNSFNQH